MLIYKYLTSFSRATFSKRYIPDGTKTTDKKCPQCGDPHGLIYEEGCLQCKSCGHSKCN